MKDKRELRRFPGIPEHVVISNEKSDTKQEGQRQMLGKGRWHKNWKRGQRLGKKEMKKRHIQGLVGGIRKPGERFKDM